MFCLLVHVLYLICTKASIDFILLFLIHKHKERIKAVCASFYFVVAAAFRWSLLCAATMTLIHIIETVWNIFIRVQVVVPVPYW